MSWMASLTPLFAGRMSSASSATRPLYLRVCSPIRFAGSALNALGSSRVDLRMKDELPLMHSQSKSGGAIIGTLGLRPATGLASFNAPAAAGFVALGFAGAGGGDGAAAVGGTTGGTSSTAAGSGTA
mmetsp:Transcript_4805/g.12921  ORF Transcript_4805/g.12921 Transcript_4805/m.12921 type:complete len:127 (+) Transcript_4805:310-690(+)